MKNNQSGAVSLLYVKEMHLIGAATLDINIPYSVKKSFKKITVPAGDPLTSRQKPGRFRYLRRLQYTLVNASVTRLTREWQDFPHNAQLDNCKKYLQTY